MIENLLDQTTEEEILKKTKPDDLPEKFWDGDKNEIRVDALLKSYLALETKMSQKRPEGELPPASADEYSITLSSDLLKNDPEVNARLHAKGFTNTQVQEVYDLAAERLVPMITGMMHDVQADREIDRLVEYFGGAENWTRVAKQLLSFGQKNLTPAMLQSLASSYDGVMTLYKMMNDKVAPSSMIKGGQKLSMRPDEKELGKMMRDPKYWRDRDPSYIAKVTEGFQELYS